MASSKPVPQFVKYLSSDDCSSDQIVVPRKFSIYHDDVLVEDFIISIRNGYKLPLTYDSIHNTIYGMSDLFADFGLIGGEVLIFEYVERDNFNVYIIGRDGSEIQYPAIVHASQTCAPLTVCSADGGWRFLKFVSFEDSDTNEFVPPMSFFAEFEAMIPARVKYMLNNGIEYAGHFDHSNRRLLGFTPLCDALGLSNYKSFDSILFHYDNARSFKISFFDGRNVEILLDNDVLASGHLCFSLRYPSHFAFEVKACHMLPYAYGVDIPVEFFRVFDFWKKKDSITVYDGSCSWVLEVRKRQTGKRTTINEGWIKFRNDLYMNIGDKCWFKWIDESYHRFRVEVFRVVIEID